ncbi:MAG: hypothetical protein IIB57_07655 [Planctomycetes bacterium]|nr:hypothetical protein [Planctomycetota bacterium]
MMKESTQKFGGLRRFLLPVASLCLGLVVFAGTASLADREDSVLQGVSVGSVGSDSALSSSAASISEFRATNVTTPNRQRKVAPTGGQQSQGGTDPVAVEMDEEDIVRHVGRVISSTPVPSSGNAAASRAAGGLAIGSPCSCDQDCAASGDQCNVVQCIVRGLCTGDNATPCSSDGDCTDNGTCDAAARCFVRQIAVFDHPHSGADRDDVSQWLVRRHLGDHLQRILAASEQVITNQCRIGDLGQRDVRAILGVLRLDPGATKGIITTTSDFAPGIADEFQQVIPYQLETSRSS